jgi:hypothetical protein
LRRQSKRSIILYTAFFLILIACTISFIIREGEGLKDTSVVAYVNDEPVEYREFQLWMGREKNGILVEFQSKYDASTSDPNFWTRSYDGKRPIDVLKDTTMQKIILTKVQQSLARNNGLLESGRYQVFFGNWKLENERRMKAIQNKEPVYGPVQFNESGYYDYVHSNLILRLKEKLGENELKPTDEQLATLYDEMKDSLFREEDTIKIKQWKIGRMDKNAQKAISTAKDAIGKGESFELAVRLAGGQTDEITLDAITRKAALELTPKLLEATTTLSEGETSEVLDVDGGLSFVYCIERQSGEYQKFVDVKPSLSTSWIDRAYDQKIDELVKSVNINLIKNFDRIQIGMK